MKKTVLPLILLSVLAYWSLQSFSPGAAVGANINATRSPVGCNCHGDAGVSTPGINITLQVLDGATPVSAYTPGSSYTIRLTGTNTTSGLLPRFGYQLTAVNAAGTANAGSLSAPSGSHAHTVSGINVIEQSSSLMPSSGTGAAGTQYTVNIPWVAPAAGTGTVSVYTIVNAVNNNGAYDVDDKWNTGSLTIAEAGIPTSIPVTATANTISVYPNPARNTFTISTPQLSAPAQLYIVNTAGQLVRTYNIANTTTTVTPGLPSGLYHVTLKSGSSNYSSLVVIE